MNGFAIASLVVSLAGILTYGIGFVLGVIFGHVGLSQINRSRGLEGGRGLAIAGLVVGYVGIGVVVLAVLGAAFAPTTTF